MSEEEECDEFCNHCEKCGVEISCDDILCLRCDRENASREALLEEMLQAERLIGTV